MKQINVASTRLVSGLVGVRTVFVVSENKLS